MSKPKFKPITLEDLNMTDEQMEVFLRGARFLWGSESDAMDDDETKGDERDAPANPDGA